MDVYAVDVVAARTPTVAPRVCRGGDWDGNDPAWVRAACHIQLAVADRFDILGFRASRDCKRARR